MKLRYLLITAFMFVACDSSAPVPPPSVGKAPVCFPTWENPLGDAIPGQCMALEMHCDEATGVVTSNATPPVTCEHGCTPGTLDSTPVCSCVYEPCDESGSPMG